MEVGIKELRMHLSRWLRLAREGNEIVVTDRGCPVARIVGVSRTPALDGLVEQGLVRLPLARRRPPSEMTRIKAKGSVAELVGDQRR
jgi:prevent-host-death family protein